MPPIALSDFDFEVPKEVIAQTPADPRDSARLMVLNRESRTLEHRIFRDIVDYLHPGDLLVVNNTKVIPARLEGRKTSGGRIEVMLLREVGEGRWETLIFPGGRVDIGTEIQLDHGSYACRIEKRSDDGIFTITSIGEPIRIESLSKIGRVPLPPYVEASRKSAPDLEAKYQTVYAKENGASAAPTAGLHFTDELLQRIREKGIGIAEITLHTGFATFRPVRSEYVEDHAIHSEWFSVSEDVAQKIRKTKERGGRVIAVGTTVVRALESIGNDKSGGFSGETSLYILPGHRFQIVDAMISNFHWPRTTLILLVAAFAGRENILAAYREAIEMQYRFFSFGDAMFIL